MRLIATLTLFYSAHSLACPYLAGTYTCEISSTKKEIKVVSQTMKGAVTTYWVNGFEIVTDNQQRAVPENESLRQGTFRAWCDDDLKVKTQLLGKYYNSGGYFGELTANSEWFFRNDGRLVRESSGDIRSPDGTVIMFADEVLCARN